jgi:hypothetical protein
MSFMEHEIAAPIAVMSDAGGVAELPRQALVLVIEDGLRLSSAFEEVCDFLDISVERIGSHYDLAGTLAAFRPMAVVAEFDCRGMDGGHVLMAVAGHDRTLPVVLLTAGDPAVEGAADAVQEVWRLTAVAKWAEIGAPGQLVDFLLHAGRAGQCLRQAPLWPAGSLRH